MVPAPDTVLDPDAMLLGLSTSAKSPDAGRALRSWLDAGLGIEPVRPYVTGWLRRYAHLEEAGFVLNAWLKAGGGWQPVRRPVLRWLQTHGEIKQASYVLTAWLKAGGSPKAVQETVHRWLSLYAPEEEAVFVLSAWIASRGSLTAVKGPTLLWLRKHLGRPGGLTLIRPLAARLDLPYELLRSILEWCLSVPQPALQILARLEANLLHPGLTAEVLSVFDLAVRPLLHQPRLLVTQRTSLATLFEILGESPVLRARTADAFLLWIHHSGAFRNVMAREQLLRHRTDRPATLRYVADLVRSRDLDPERDRRALLRCFRWINTWVASRPEQARELLAELSRPGASEP